LSLLRAAGACFTDASDPGVAKLEGANRGFRVEVAYFRQLRDLGREAGQAWLKASIPSRTNA
jgi:hypothetical protein